MSNPVLSRVRLWSPTLIVHKPFTSNAPHLGSPCHSTPISRDKYPPLLNSRPRLARIHQICTRYNPGPSASLYPCCGSIPTRASAHSSSFRFPVWRRPPAPAATSQRRRPMAVYSGRCSFVGGDHGKLCARRPSHSSGVGFEPGICMFIALLAALRPSRCFRPGVMSSTCRHRVLLRSVMIGFGVRGFRSNEGHFFMGLVGDRCSSLSCALTLLSMFPVDSVLSTIFRPELSF